MPAPTISKGGRRRPLSDRCPVWMDRHLCDTVLTHLLPVLFPVKFPWRGLTQRSRAMDAAQAWTEASPLTSQPAPNEQTLKNPPCRGASSLLWVLGLLLALTGGWGGVLGTGASGVENGRRTLLWINFFTKGKPNTFSTMD